MSLAAMGLAAFGYLPVVAGALLQELIDVAVIVNAMRALRGGVERPIRVDGWTQTRARLLAEHRSLAPGLAQLRQVADELDTANPSASGQRLQAVRGFLVDHLLPHELDEDRTIYPQLATSMGSDTATAALHGTHAEIFHQVRVLDRLVTELDDPIAPEDLTDLRRTLYGIDAIVRLHTAQEEELYLAIGELETAETARQPA